MNPDLILTRSARLLLLAAVSLLAGTLAFASNITLEGQNKGDTNNWYAVNLQNWLELDYIPCRVHFVNEQGSNQPITISFPHLNGTTPGFQDLFTFSTSSNVVFSAPPALFAPATSGTWSYTFTVNVLDNNDAYVWFFARLAAGAHLNTGSSLGLSGSPSGMGQLQIHKPAAGPGAPDLAIVKSGPATAMPGGFIIYTLTYTNHAIGTNTATGVQLTDIFPPQVIVNTNGLPAGGRMTGNTLYVDVTNLPPGAGGQVSFQVQVDPAAAVGTSFTNFSQILSAEDDANYSYNSST